MAIEPAVAASLKILAIETSTELCSVALLVGEDLHCDAALAPNQHAERLMPMIRQLLGSADLPMSGVDAVAFGQGPGSFTGLRIACGIAQGLALGASRPVIAVPSVLALAEQAGGARVVVGLVHHRRAFYGHMWTEAYVGAWMPLDATRARGGVGPDHIPLGASTLESADLAELFLRFLTLAGKVEIEVIDAS